MLFGRPLASFTNNIFIDRPNNHETRHEVVCIIFCFLKITSFHTPQNNFETLSLPYKLQGGGKWQKGCLKCSIHYCFPTYFPASSLDRNRRRRRPAASRIKVKFIEHVQTKYITTPILSPLMKALDRSVETLGLWIRLHSLNLQTSVASNYVWRSDKLRLCSARCLINK